MAISWKREVYNDHETEHAATTLKSPVPDVPKKEFYRSLSKKNIR